MIQTSLSYHTCTVISIKLGLISHSFVIFKRNQQKLNPQDMVDKKYFSHTSPTYGSPFHMIKNFGISYRSAGENIAYGQRTPAQVVNSWWNSDGHRANMLNANYTDIGVGYAANGNYWTQMFIQK